MDKSAVTAGGADMSLRGRALDKSLLPDYVRRLNGEITSINTIEFGIGPNLRSDNFLMQVARENGGQHVYVDMLRRGRPE